MKKAHLDSSAFLKIFLGGGGAEHMERVVHLAKKNHVLFVFSEWVVNENICAAIRKQAKGQSTRQDDLCSDGRRIQRDLRATCSV